MQNLEIIQVWIVPVSETLLFHCCFNDYSLMIFWGEVDEILMTSMQKLIISKFCDVLLFESLMLCDCFIDEFLKEQGWNTDDFVLNNNSH